MYICNYGLLIKFEWDEAKNAKNVRKHGIDFRDALNIFSKPVLTAMDRRNDYDEERWIALGRVEPLVGVVVYTEREGNVIRIISARKATRQEVRRYEQRV